MSPPLPRYTNTYTTTVSHTRRPKLEDLEQPTNPIMQANPADLRGIPCIAKGVGGTAPHTNPLTETIAREHRNPTPQRIPLDKWLRGQIIERDGPSCYLCGLECKDHEIHIDHVIPVALGGDNHPTNLRVACRICNIRKGKKLLGAPPPIRSKVKRGATPVVGRPPQPWEVISDREAAKAYKASHPKHL